MTCAEDSAISLEHRQVISIDGPAAAGKSTVAKLLSDRLGALLFDTGVLYRAVSLIALRDGVRPDDEVELSRIAREASIEIRTPTKNDGRLYDVCIAGDDVTWELRSAEVGAIVSEVAEHHSVRMALLPLQRTIAAKGPVVMVGRDVGTVVVPDAGLKIYLDASPEERARRRFNEATARGSHESFNDVLRETQHRDEVDTTRESAPLRAAPDAVRIATDVLDVSEVVHAIEQLARTRVSCGEPLWPR
jgi:CMP/dCMP kinase